MSINRTEDIARLSDDVCDGLKNLCFIERWHKKFYQTTQHMRLSVVVIPSLEMDAAAINTSVFTQRSMSGHTCNTEKLFTSAYSGALVGRFSRKVGQTPTHTLSPQQRFPHKNLILLLYVTFYESRKEYSVTDRKRKEGRTLKGKFVPVHVLKTSRGRGGISTHILNRGTRCR